MLLLHCKVWTTPPSGAATRSSGAGWRSTATLQKLKAVAAHLKNGSGDPALDGVLAEIELRVEVEIAKLATA
jgi:hypothetical protein